MNIAELLAQEMETSKQFANENFGTKIGSDYGPIVLECIDNERVRVAILMSFIKNSFSAKGVAEAVPANADQLPNFIRRTPAIYQTPAEFFYWGIQVGRKLEREQAAALSQIAEL